MDIQKLLNQAAAIAAHRLKELGGMSNGYDTWIDGTVSKNAFGTLRLFTPACDKKTYAQVRKFGYDLEQEIRNILLKTDLEPFDHIRFIKHQDADGCYRTEVSYKTAAKVTFI